MNKLQQTLLAGALVVSPLLMTASVGAIGVTTAPTGAQTCEVGFTGPNSNNQCVSETQFECEIVNDNKVNIVNENFQVAVSGNASGEGGAETGGALTGSATNDNGVTFDVTVKNTGVEGTPVCTVVATTVPVTPAPTPEKEKEPVPAPEAKVVPKVLAKTEANPVVMVVASVLGLAVLVLASLKVATAVVSSRR